MEVLRTALPGERLGTSAIVYGGHAYVFGGLKGSSGHPAAGKSITDEIVRVDLAVEALNAPPVSAIAPAAEVQECGDVVVDGSLSSDADDDTLLYRWFVRESRGWTIVGFQEGMAAGTSIHLKPGAHEVRLRVSDTKEKGFATRSMQVVDTVPPEIRFIKPMRGRLYFGGHRGLPPGSAANPWRHLTGSRSDD